MSIDAIGAKIKATAKKRGVTQLQLADALGVTQSFVSALYTCKKTPSLDMLTKLCDFLGVSPNELLGYSENEQSAYMSAAEITLVASYRSLSTRDKETVNVLIDTLSKSSPTATSLTSLSGSGFIDSDGKTG